MQCRRGRYTAAVIGNKLHRMWKESERATWFSLPSIGGGAFVCHTPLPSSPAQQIEISETSDGGLSVRRAALLQPPFSVLRPDSGTVVVQRAARSFCSRNHLGFRVIALQRDQPLHHTSARAASKPMYYRRNARRRGVGIMGHFRGK